MGIALCINIWLADCCRFGCGSNRCGLCCRYCRFCYGSCCDLCWRFRNRLCCRSFRCWFGCGDCRQLTRINICTAVTAIFKLCNIALNQGCVLDWDCVIPVNICRNEGIVCKIFKPYNMLLNECCIADIYSSVNGCITHKNHIIGYIRVVILEHISIVEVVVIVCLWDYPDWNKACVINIWLIKRNSYRNGGILWNKRNVLCEVNLVCVSVINLKSCRRVIAESVVHNSLDEVFVAVNILFCTDRHIGITEGDIIWWSVLCLAVCYGNCYTTVYNLFGCCERNAELLACTCREWFICCCICTEYSTVIVLYRKGEVACRFKAVVCYRYICFGFLACVDFAVVNACICNYRFWNRVGNCCNKLWLCVHIVINYLRIIICECKLAVNVLRLNIFNVVVGWNKCYGIWPCTACRVKIEGIDFVPALCVNDCTVAVFIVYYFNTVCSRTWNVANLRFCLRLNIILHESSVFVPNYNGFVKNFACWDCSFNIFCNYICFACGCVADTDCLIVCCRKVTVFVTGVNNIFWLWAFDNITVDYRVNILCNSLWLWPCSVSKTAHHNWVGTVIKERIVWRTVHPNCCGNTVDVFKNRVCIVCTVVWNACKVFKLVRPKTELCRIYINVLYCIGNWRIFRKLCVTLGINKINLISTYCKWVRHIGIFVVIKLWCFWPLASCWIVNAVVKCECICRICCIFVNTLVNHYRLVTAGCNLWLWCGVCIVKQCRIAVAGLYLVIPTRIVWQQFIIYVVFVGIICRCNKLGICFGFFICISVVNSRATRHNREFFGIEQQLDIQTNFTAQFNGSHFKCFPDVNAKA